MGAQNVVWVLGTAQDGGIPHAGCACAVCDAAHHSPERRRLVASLAVVGASGRTLLVDATPDVVAQLDRVHRALGRPPPAIDAVLVTHAHMGHYLGLAFLGREGLDVDALPLFGTACMLRFLSANRPWAHLVTRGNVEPRPVRADETFAFDGLSVVPVPSPHRAEDTDTIGVEIRGPSRRLLYVPDADRFTPDLVARIEGSDVALVDGTFYDRAELGRRDVDQVPHPFVEESVALLAGARGRVFFTHLNHTNRLLHPDPGARASLPTGFEILGDGASFPV